LIPLIDYALINMPLTTVGLRTSPTRSRKPRRGRAGPAGRNTRNYSTLDDSIKLSHPRFRELSRSVMQRKESYVFGTIVVASAASFNAISFLWSSLNSATTLASVYEQYRILKCRVRFVPVFTQSNSNASGNVSPGFLHSVIDYDDANSPSNTNAMTKYSTYRTVNATRPLTVVVKPMSAVGAYSGVVFTGFDSVYGQWHQTASPSINHYGVKYGVDDNNFAAAQTIYTIEIDMWYECRGQK